MEKSDLFSGISPRGAAGVIVSTLNAVSNGQTLSVREEELIQAIERYTLPHLGTRSARLFEAIRARVTSIARGNNGGRIREILDELVQCGFTHPRVKSIPLDLIERKFPKAAKIIARKFPLSSSGGIILTLAKDMSGHWRLFA